MKISKNILNLMLVFGIIYYVSACSKTQTSEEQTETIVPVNVVTAERGTIEEKINFLGNIKGFREIKIYSLIPNKIIKINVDVGDWVNKGAILAVVESDKIEEAVKQANAGLEAAKAQCKNIETEWNRIKKLYDDNAVSKSQYDAITTQRDAARANVKQLEAAVATAKKQLEDTNIKAPINGIISSRLLDVGDQASPQIPVFTIVEMDNVKITIEVIESQFNKIQIGQKAYINVDTYPDTVFIGKISKISPTLNIMTKTATAEIIIPNPGHKLRPGMFARVDVITDIHKDALIIPKYSIIERTSLEYIGGDISSTKTIVNKFVFVVESGIAREVPIETGIENGKIVEILQGLKDGDLIVSLGQHNLSDSVKVEIIEKGKSI
ncbi:MAG TPA: efflux RND transporter periplasmic adaptor subunit [Candidatus Marinimicrobia bacterium]|nr:efflux RND transporter periplasmic adaptor subunit [Candidatus Neomarinimicrobiota bacterium]HRS52065.1 efflux RND transporter periplasmic adaptor subunit [Candidatus Neomarinimicrobiota bacterium]HRU93073.1 efflux RND transporter periplasmic adaptor subunit [Candidatus Neomarinimicrobiota bacterium]